MKRNKITKVAAVLFALTLVTTCLIGGTFAKYITKADANDTTARVAKWGVVINESGGLFSKTYVDEENGNIPGETSITVSSSDDDNVVAPGTQSSEEGLTFSITGEPEVKVNVNVAFSSDNDIFLNAGTYKDYTDTSSDNTFEVADTYNPVKFTLVKDGEDDALVEDGTLEDIEDYFTENFSEDAVYEPNTDLSDAFGTYTLTWKWDFTDADEETTITDNDRMDTLLGNLAADSSIEAKAKIDGESTTFSALSEEDYSTDIGLTFTITVTQVD